MKAPDHKPSIPQNIDGNAFAIMGAVKKALQRAGADAEYIDQYLNEAKSGDYDNLLRVSMKYADFV